MSEVTYHLGQRVRIDGIAIKDHVGIRTVYTAAPPPLRVTGWSDGKRVCEPYVEGIITGWRTLVQGTTESATEDDDYFGGMATISVFLPDPGPHARGWVVAYDLRRKPVTCFEDQIEGLFHNE